MEQIEDRGVIRLEGGLRFDRAVKAAADGIRLAREQGLRKLMIVTSGSTGLGALSVTGFGLAGDVFTSEEEALAWLSELP